jgi:hypothetical protein
VALATGLTRKTIHFGIRALKAEAAAPNQALPADRIRRGGGGRKPMTHTQPKRVAALDARVEPTVARRSPVATALDLQAYAPLGRGIAEARVPRA